MNCVKRMSLWIKKCTVFWIAVSDVMYSPLEYLMVSKSHGYTVVNGIFLSPDSKNLPPRPRPLEKALYDF